MSQAIPFNISTFFFIYLFQTWKINPFHVFTVFHNIRQNKLGANQQNSTEIVNFKQMKHFCIFYFNQNLFRWISGWCWFCVFYDLLLLLIFSFTDHYVSGPDPESPVLRRNLTSDFRKNMFLFQHLWEKILDIFIDG